jgi:hypothetical protein
MARPSKIERFSKALEEVLNRPKGVGMAIMHTDADLIFLVNDMLEPDDRISDITFRKWKAGENTSDDALREVFVSLYKRALMNQRDALFESMSEEPPGAWQKWAWILERKFDEWSLRQRVVDETSAPKQLVLRVKRDE